MTPYIVLYIFLIFTQLLYGRVCLSGNIKRIHKFDNQLFIWYCVVVCLMICTRTQTVGTDTESYVNFFHHSRFYYHDKPTDWGFEQLGRFFHLFGSSTEWLIFWSGLLSMVGVIYLIKKYSYHKSTSMTLFVLSGTTFIFFQMYLSAVRQACALTFYIIAVCLLFEGKDSKKKLVLAIALLAFAYLIHGSTLFGLSFVILAYLCPLTNKKAWYILIWAFYVLAVLNISYVNNILAFVFDLIGGNKYDKYVDVAIGEVAYTGRIINMYLLPYSLLMTVVVYLCRRDVLRRWWVQLPLMGAVMTNLFYDNLMWGRLLFPLTIFFIVAIPNTLEMGKKAIRIPIYFVFIAYFLYKSIKELVNSFAHGYINDINTVVPYESCLFDFFK